MKGLSDRPRLESLEATLDAMFTARGEDIEFVVLYGSMARGDWSRGSDFGVLVGLWQDPQPRWIDRLGTFLDFSWEGDVEILPYSLDQIERMFRRFNLVVLAALRDGVVLYDCGAWLRYRERYQDLLARGLLISEGRAWRWTEEAERLLAAEVAESVVERTAGAVQGDEPTLSARGLRAASEEAWAEDAECRGKRTEGAPHESERAATAGPHYGES